MVINFISSKDSDETRTMDAKSDNIEIMIGNETNEIIGERFNSLLQRYQEGLEEKMRGSDFFYYSVDLLYSKFHGIRLNQGGSYIVSPDWLNTKKATINRKNNDDKCFQHAVPLAQIHEQIKNHPESIKY